MNEIEILGANRLEPFTRTREASRAVVVQDGLILLSHETMTGWVLVPGGGLEAGETPEDCCVREVEEETGVIVRPLYQFLTLVEYYEEYRYISYYFVCESTGSGQMRLTEAEKLRGLEPMDSYPDSDRSFFPPPILCRGKRRKTRIVSEGIYCIAGVSPDEMKWGSYQSGSSGRKYLAGC